MKASHLLLSFCCLFSVGCQKPVEDGLPSNNLQLRGVGNDRVIVPRAQKRIPVSSPGGSWETSELFEHIYVMQNLGEKTRQTTWAADSQEFFLQFYEAAGYTSTSRFSESPYVDFLIANSQSDFMKATEGLDLFFANEKLKIQNLLDGLSSSFPFPTQAISISSAIDILARLMNQFETEVNKSTLDPAIKEAVLSGVYHQFWLQMPAASQLLAQFEESPDFEGAVAILRSFVADLEIELDQEISGKITSASQIGAMLNKPNLSASEAFQILIELWDQMSDQERLETFGETSPDLYRFLSGKKKKERECLKRKDCGALLLRLAKKLFILPEIKKYGVDRLRREIEASAVAAIKEQTGLLATEMIRSVPSLLLEQINAEMDAELSRLNQYRSNYPEFVRTEVQKWFEREFDRPDLPALEHRLAQVQFPEVNNPVFAGRRDLLIETSPDTLGTALLASEQLFKKPRAKTLRKSLRPAQILGLTRVNQLLAHGGFLQVDGKPFESLSRHLSTRGQILPLNIQSDFDFPGLFFMPTPLKVKAGFQFAKDSLPANLRIRDQARLLLGFTKTMEAFKDWSKAPMDDLLGDIRASELLESLPAEQITVPAFPKDAFLAVAFGNAASVLSNLKSKGSPLSLLCHDGAIAWADSEFECSQPTAKAALVDVKGQKRQDIVHAVGQAHFLLALIEFLKTSEQILKNTRSDYLLSTESGGQSPLQIFSEIYPDLEGLALALTNFLSGNLQGDQGEIFESWNLKDGTRSKRTLGFRESLIVLQALVSSAKHFGLPPHQRSAVRSYFYMNRHFYDEDLQFYKTSGNKVLTTDLALALYVLPQLESLLPTEASRSQLRQLRAIWESSFRGQKL